MCLNEHFYEIDWQDEATTTATIDADSSTDAILATADDGKHLQYFVYSSDADKASSAPAFNDNSIDPTALGLNDSENRPTFTDSPSHTSTETSTIDEYTDAHTATESDYSSYVIPLKIILPIEHVHKASDDQSFARYNYILLKVDDVAYHEHINSDNPDILIPVRAENAAKSAIALQSTSEHSASSDAGADNTIVDNTETMPAIQSNGNSILIDPQGFRYELDRHYKIADDSDNVLVEFDDIKVAQTSQKERWNDFEPEQSAVGADDEQFRSMSSEILSAHYRKLYQWLTW